MKRIAVLLAASILFAGPVIFGKDNDSKPVAGKTIQEHTQLLLKAWEQIAKSINEDPAKVDDKAEPVWEYLESCCFTAEIEKQHPLDFGKMLKELMAGNLAFDKTYEDYQAVWKEDAARYLLVKDLFGKYSKAEIFRYQEWLNSYKDELEELRDDKPEVVKGGVKVMTAMFTVLGDWAKPSGKNTGAAALKCLLELARAHAQISLLELETGWGRPPRGLRGVWEDSEDSILNTALYLSKTAKGAATPKVSEALATLKKNAGEWSRNVATKNNKPEEYKAKCAGIYKQLIEDITSILKEIKD